MARTISAFRPTDPAPDGEPQDLRIDESGNLEIVDGLEDARQRVAERLRFWSSQWFLAVDEGVPYRSEIFQNPTSIGLASAVVSDAIRSVPGVAGVTDVVANINPETRRMTYSARVQTGDGEFPVTEVI